MSEADAPAPIGAAVKGSTTSSSNEPIPWERKRFGSWPPQFFRSEQPTYIASALCVLFGMYLTASGLEQDAWGRVGLAATMSIYQALLIGGAALLLRVGQRRSAFLLALVSCVFIVDPTLRLEGVVTLDRFGFGLAAVWGALSLTGIHVLARVLGTRLNASAWYAIGSSVVIIAAGPVLIRLPDLPRGHVLLSSWWIIATLLFVAASAGSVRSSLARDGNEAARLDRAIRVLAHFAPLGALAHVLVSMHAFDERPLLPHLLPLLALAPLRARDELRTWIFAGLLMLLMSVDHLSRLPCAGLLVVVLTYKGSMFGLGRPRLYIGAVLCLYLAMGNYGHVPLRVGEWEPWMLNTSVGLLLALAARYRMPTAAVAAALLWHYGKPQGQALTPTQWGALLLVVGFAGLLFALARDVRRSARALPMREGVP